MVNKRRIYQIYCGRWESANVIEHEGQVLHRLVKFDWAKLKQDLRLEAIYLLGLWDVTGPIKVNTEEGVDLAHTPNRCPSAFAISDHTQVWPKLGELKDLLDLMAAIKAQGLKVYVDFVANHTGLNNAWVKENPKLYKMGVAGALNTAFSGDVVELDYQNKEVWEKMTGVALKLASYGVSGFRCDMAHLVDSAFWQQLITQVKEKYPDFYFIAECYGTSVFDQTNREVLLKAGFDSIYDGGLYNNLKDYAHGGSLANLAAHLNFVSTNTSNKWTHYASNHDDAYPLPEKLFWPTFCLVLALTGDSLIFNGFNHKYLKRLAHHYIEILPDKYVSETNPKKLSEWINIISKPGLQIEQFEAIKNLYLRASWRAENENGYILFNFSDKSVVDEVAGIRVNPYQSIVVNNR